MKVGSLVYATEQGLGYLAKSFFDNGVVTDVLVLAHGSRPNRHEEWYPGRGFVSSLYGRSGHEQVREFCRRQDVMLFFETPFDWELIPFCRRHGVRTALMPMYECTPEVLPALPDVFLCPSPLDFGYYDRYGAAARHLPVPAPPPAEVPWKQRTTAEVFVHNAGHGGLKGRNGTAELIEAWRYVESDAKLILRTQSPSAVTGGFPSLRNLTIEQGTVPRDRLYAEGDVFVFPEKFNGLSLPLQEAFAAGMCVMATDRFPNDTYLPKQPLIPTAGTRRNRVSPRCNEFDEAVIDPRVLAAHVDEWYGRPIDGYSTAGRAWAAENGWERWKPEYLRVLS